MSNDTKRYTIEEERWNAISHSVGIVGGIIVSVIFIKEVIANGGDAWDLTSVLLYMFGMLSSYIFSTLYHSCSPESKWRKTLRKLDHSAIYWHIAGCYSPVTLIALLEGGATIWAWSIFAFVWLCAIVGTGISFRKMSAHSYIETACYVLMGLTIMVAFKPFYECVGWGVVGWVIAEGVCYISGAVLYSIHKVRYMHTVFHIFIILGDIFHMVAVWKILDIFLS